MQHQMLLWQQKMWSKKKMSQRAQRGTPTQFTCFNPTECPVKLLWNVKMGNAWHFRIIPEYGWISGINYIIWTCKMNRWYPNSVVNQIKIAKIELPLAASSIGSRYPTNTTNFCSCTANCTSFSIHIYWFTFAIIFLKWADFVYRFIYL